MRIRAALFLMLSACAAAVVAAEVLLRLFGISYPVFHRADPVTGLGHVPNARGWYALEGRAYVRINSEGWRDREHAAEKPPDTFRIAVLGDSHAEAFQVPEAATFWSVLERELNARAGRGYEVLNFGVGGFGTGSELMTLRRYAFKYSPDAVLLTFTSGNDVSDNLRDLKRVDYFPYFTYRNDTLVLDSSFVSSPGYLARAGLGARLMRALAAHSRVVQLLNTARGRLRAGEVVRRQGPVTRVGDEIGFDATVYREPDQAVWKEAWRVTEGLLLAMRDECRACGVSFFVVTLSNGIQVDPDRARRARFAEEIHVPDLSYPDRRVRECGERAGFEVLSLAPLLQRAADSSGVYFHGFGAKLGQGHLNEAGHLKTGRLIADWLASRIGAGGASTSDRALPNPARPSRLHPSP